MKTLFNFSSRRHWADSTYKGYRKGLLSKRLSDFFTALVARRLYKPHWRTEKKTIKNLRTRALP